MRLPRPAPLAALSLALSALLATLAGALGTPTATPGQASNFEGQGDVRIAGLADGLRRFPGGWEARLHGNGTALAVRGQGDPRFQDGDWVEAEGRVGRSAGRLTLLADRATATDAPDAASPGWASLAQDPAAWDHRPLRLSGWIERGELRDRDGHAVRLAAGPWPPGAATVTGYLSYDAGCLCHRLHGAAAPP
ncbi:MAG TPA: hypothetical protein VM241_00220 [Candidatus Thermoplasmatota archaeon]|nr:hypothetical protein [Candidatus Thermoplasmatota archaeon]